MLKQLIKKELLDHLMSLRFAIACVLCLVVVLCSVFVRSRDYVQVLNDYQQESQMARQEIENMRSPFDLAWGGEPVWVHLRPNPLRVFIRGATERGGDSAAVSTRRRLAPGFQLATNPAAVLFPPIDLVSFVGIILSLVAVVFGYDAVCGEKERGTLRLMLSYSVPRYLVLLGKWIGGYVSIVFPFALTAIAGTIILLVLGDISLTSGQWLRLAAVAAMALVYVAAVYSLAVYVSTLARRASTSLMILLSLWVIFILALPNLTPHLARALRPMAGAQDAEKQRLATQDQIESAADETVKKYRKEQGLEDQWWRNFPWGKWPEMEKVYKLWIFQAPVAGQARLETLAAWEKIDAPRRARLDDQIALGRWIGRASPFLCFAFSAAELADAGALHERQLYDQLRAYQLELTRYAFDQVLLMEQKGLEAKGRYPDWREVRPKPVPTFAYVPPAAGDYVRQTLVDAGVLAGMAVLLFLLAHVTFLRYDVR